MKMWWFKFISFCSSAIGFILQLFLIELAGLKSTCGNHGFILFRRWTAGWFGWSSQTFRWCFFGEQGTKVSNLDLIYMVMKQFFTVWYLHPGMVVHVIHIISYKCFCCVDLLHESQFDVIPILIYGDIWYLASTIIRPLMTHVCLSIGSSSCSSSWLLGRNEFHRGSQWQSSRFEETTVNQRCVVQ